jgi:hypothetical protein
MIERAFEKTLNAGISPQANFIFGDIAETKETAYETLDWWKKNSKGQIGLSFVQAYPGSAIYEICMEKGLLGNKEEFLKNLKNNVLVNMTEFMTDKELIKLKKDLLDCERKYNKFSSLKNLKKTSETTHSFDVKCPFCKTVLHYEKFNLKSANIRTTTRNYHLRFLCRVCPMSFTAISPLRCFIYKYFPIYALKKLSDKYNQVSISLRKTKR